MKISFGTFLKQKRKEKNLTQKELANMLFVSESAVSKWEKDVARPDMALLPDLSLILGVTEHELITASIDKKTREEKIQAKKWRAVSLTWSLFFYIAYAITILTCFICNLAIDKTLSWFWIVLSALMLSFTFTNLPKLIKKHKLIFIPLSNFVSLCLLLAICAIYTNGKWFWIVVLPILLGFVVIFAPIYICRYKIFYKIKKYGDFVSLALGFVLLNVLLIVIDGYTFANGYAISYWYFNWAFVIVVAVYLVLNLFLSVRFLKINKFLKTGIILTLVDCFLYIVPMFIKTDNELVQKEIDNINIFMADFSNWQVGVTIEQNVHCIIFLTVICVAVVFFAVGVIRYLKKRHKDSVALRNQ